MLFYFTLIVFLYFLILISGKILYDRGVSSFAIRNISKFFAYILVICMHAVLNLDLMIFTCVLFTLIFFAFRKSKMLESVFGRDEKTIAPILLPIGIIIISLTFWSFKPYIFQLACLVMAFSDVFSKILSRQIDGINFSSRRKTLTGSVVFFATTIILYLFMFGVYKIGLSSDRMFKALVSTATLTFVQSSFDSNWDNLPLPFLTGLMSVWVFYG